ncbi:hypothetical protein [Galactobacter sp.]|uniref:hypothetical protein n=1 Tax=Galactobacter sp. TaxID=2676125 RepID=UPI0025B8A203|nr:hypothetical protein [Galactobacter sp.]
MRPEPSPPSPLHIPAEIIWAPSDPVIRGQYRRGRLVRLAPGIYVGAEVFMKARRHERFLYVAAAKAMRCPDVIFAGETALLLAGMPIFGTPEVVAVAAQQHHRLGSEAPAAAVSSAAAPDLLQAVQQLPRIQRRLRPVEAPDRHGDFWTVPIDVAVASSAAQLPFCRALAVADGRLRHAAHLALPADALSAAIDEERSRTKRDRATLVASLADPLAENGHESAGRSIMLQHGFERPELQRRFVDHEGEIFPDYFFPSRDHAAEGDGFGKYLEPELLRGRTTRQALAEQKHRQSRLEFQSRGGVSRWSREDVMCRPQVIVQRLQQVGIPSKPEWRIRLR